MKYLLTILLLASLYIQCRTTQQTTSQMNKDTSEFELLWQEVDSLEKEGLYASSLKKVDLLLDKGRAQKAKDHVIKALFYRAKYNITLKEDAAESTLNEFETELAKESDESYQRIYHSILGQLYSQYAQQNQYKIRNRTADLTSGQDIAAMSLAQLINKSNDHYNESVRELNDQALDLHNYEILIDRKNMKDEELDLYSLLLIRALKHFKNDMNMLTEPVYVSNLYSPKAFGDINSFLKESFLDDGESQSSKTHAIHLYQKLLKYHINDPILDRLNIDRLNYIYQIHKAADKKELYRASLLNLAQETNYAKFELAELDYNAQSKTSEAKSKNVQAHQALQEIIKDEVDKDLVNKAKILRQAVEQPVLNLGVEKVLLPDSPSLFSIEFKNLDEISFVIKESSDEILQKLAQLRNQEQQLQFIQALETQTFWTQKLPDSQFTNISSELLLAGLPIGQYIILAESKGVSSFSQLIVSNLSYAANNSNTGVQYVIADRKSGKPLQGVKAELYERTYSRGQQSKSIIANKVSDKEGRVEHRYSGNKAINLRLQINGDVLDLQQGLNPIYKGNQSTRQTVHTFTDRNMYRPGQRVYVKAIVLQSDEDGINPAFPAKNEKLTLTAYNVNRQEIHKIDIKTNEFGSISTDFKLPKSGLGGQYSMEIFSESGARQYTSIKVEEYKRPTFFSELIIPDIAFQLGDSISITGKSAMFSGSPLDDATIEYRITRNKIRFHHWYRYSERGGHGGESAEIKYGSTKTNSKGEFGFDFVLEEGSDNLFSDNPVYVFLIEITTTDNTGETHTSSKQVRVSRKNVFISSDLSESIDLHKTDSITITSQNINNAQVPFTGRLSIYSLTGPSTYRKSKYWSDLDTTILSDADYKNLPDDYQFNNAKPENWPIDTEVFSTAFKSDGSYALKMPSTLKAGYYKIEIQNTVTDDIEYQTISNVFNFETAQFDKTKLFENKLNKDTYTVSDDVQLSLGSAQQDINVYYQLEKGSAIIEARWLTINRNTKQITIPVGEKDKGGFIVHLTAFYKNRIQQEHIPIHVPYVDKKLKVNIESFKSTLEPGSNEEWTIKILDHNDKPVVGELVASMYDASLDAIGYSHDWQTFRYVNYRSKLNHHVPGYQMQYFRYLKYRQGQYYNTGNQNSYFPDFNFFGYMLTGNQFAREGRVMKSRSSAPAPMSAEPMMDAADESSISAQSTVESSNESIEEVSQEIDWSSVRDVLDETVFFSPSLITDQEGNSTIKFKMSEALSSWKLQVFAHDMQARYGYELFELKTQKDLSIFPNVPRFLRVQDQLTISGKIINSTDSNIKTSSTIQFINPDTNEDVTDQLIDKNATIHQYVNANASHPVSWSINVDESMLGGLIYRMQVGHEFGSDAIEGFLPVTTNRVLITESMPLYVGAKQSKRYTLETLDRLTASNTAELNNYIVEYTANPSWYVFQALPYLAAPEVKSSSQILNQYVSHCIGRSITESMPQLKGMIQNWERQSQDDQDSPLRRNAALKIAALENTPWLRQSISEEEQRARLIEFYNDNQSNALIENALKELLRFQNPDGGFSWLPGKASSEFISSTILESIGRLNKQNIVHGITDQVIAKLITYVDAAIVKKAKKLKEEKSYNSNPLQLLYARSYFADTYPVPAEFDVLLKKSHEKWQEKALHQQAQLAMVLARVDQGDSALKITASLQEQMISTEDKGGYWKLNRDSYSNHSSIDKHVIMIELYHEMDVEQDTIDQLRIWLLRNKHTNHWKTNQSTASAVYAFLMNTNNQSDWINHSSMATIHVGDARLKTQPESAALYIKETMNISQLNAKSKEISIENPNEQSGWGAAYIQFYEDIDRVQNNSLDELSIQKEIFKQVMTDEGPQLQTLSDVTLIPGDRLIVKLVIQTDRSLEYVHIRDERGSGLEPTDVLSGYTNQDEIYYYQETKDASSNFYISRLPRGMHVIEYSLKANLAGTYATGMATIQCMYAAEFISHSNNINLVVSPSK